MRLRPLPSLPMPRVLPLVLTLALVGLALAGDEDRPREVRRYRKDEVVRRVDVTDMPAMVRTAVEKRLETDGFVRLADEEEGPVRGRDLESDVRELVRHGGRFPDPPIESGFLGAPVRLAGEPHGARSLHFLGTREGSLATALGLGRGDRILALDGAEPTPQLLAVLVGVELRPGQLALRVQRREGRVEHWTLTFSRGAPAATR